MNNRAFRIQHGELLDVTGHPVRHQEITFVPASIELWGSSFSFSFPFHEFTANWPFATKALVKPGNDAPWVLGRLMYLFGTDLCAEEFRPEKACFSESFIAVLHSRENLSIPFTCTDYYCKSSLMFSSEDPPADELQQEIAGSFWSLLLSAPTDVVDYESRMFHSGACIWIRFGVESGESFLTETDE